MARLGDGSLRSWGGNDSGQLGTGSTGGGGAAVSTPLGLPPVTALAAGNDHVLALTDDGQVWAWGSNDAGQLGRSTPLSASDGAPGLSDMIGTIANPGFTVAGADLTVRDYGLVTPGDDILIDG
ncbi:MAG TPA: RCC1 repeat-containing protein, partial [Gemmatimonadetes bacterium]|nr:RCC1 repeat-containing protein [Gemmatimonadota bacterium]